jgi:hypothetical protein
MRHPPKIVRRHRQDAMSVGVYAARLEANAQSIAGSGGPDHRHSSVERLVARSTLGVLVLVGAAT